MTTWNNTGATTDRLGSIRAMDNGERYSYYPYGESHTATGGNAQFAGLESPVRTYDPNTARFNRPDPLGMRAVVMGDPGSWNRFAYAGGDPVNYNDPDGTNRVDPDTPPPPNYAYMMGILPVWNGEYYTNVVLWTPVALPSNQSGTGTVGGGTSSPNTPLSNWDFMAAALAQALKDLAKPGCGDAVFAGGIANGHDPAQVLQAIAGGTAYGSISFKDLGEGVGAQENARFRLPLQSKKVSITINSYSDPGGVYWNDGNAGVNAITLLHELGHAFNDLFGSGSSTIENDVNWRGKMNMDAETRNDARLAPCKK